MGLFPKLNSIFMRELFRLRQHNIFCAASAIGKSAYEISNCSENLNWILHELLHFCFMGATNVANVCWLCIFHGKRNCFATAATKTNNDCRFSPTQFPPSFPCGIWSAFGNCAKPAIKICVLSLYFLLLLFAKMFWVGCTVAGMWVGGVCRPWTANCVRKLPA